jgi:hypothetical protein
MKAPEFGFYFDDEQLREHFRELLFEPGTRNRQQLLDGLTGTDFEEHAWWCPCPPPGTRVKTNKGTQHWNAGEEGQVRKISFGNWAIVALDRRPGFYRILPEDFEVL